MHPPFTAEQFLDVFRRYNDAVWPAQIALIAVGCVSTFAAYRANVRRSWRWAQLSLVLLAVLWLWAGIVYDKRFLLRLSLSGEIFGSLFIAEAGLLLITAWQNGTSFECASRPAAVAGSAILVYTLFLYPALAVFFGQQYPALPTFGAPCPVTIFTFGIFCLLTTSIPRFAIAIPVLWAVIGTYAAIGFGVREDLGLLVAAAVTIAVRATPRNRPSTTQTSPAGTASS